MLELGNRMVKKDGTADLVIVYVTEYSVAGYGRWGREGKPDVRFLTPHEAQAGEWEKRSGPLPTDMGWENCIRDIEKWVAYHSREHEEWGRGLQAVKRLLQETPRSP